MIKTGIIRKFDVSGSIIIPKAVREKIFGEDLRNIEGKPMEIFYKKDGTIILKPVN